MIGYIGAAPLKLHTEISFSPLEQSSCSSCLSPFPKSGWDDGSKFAAASLCNRLHSLSSELFLILSRKNADGVENYGGVPAPHLKVQSIEKWDRHLACDLWTLCHIVQWVMPRSLHSKMHPIKSLLLINWSFWQPWLGKPNYQVL